MTEATDDKRVSTARSAEITERFYHGDLLKLLVDVVKGLPVAWALLPEAEQAKVLRKLDLEVKDITRKAIGVLRARDAAYAIVTLKSVAVTDGFKATIEFEKSSSVKHVAVDSVGDDVMIVFPGYKAFEGGDPPKADPDQRQLKGLDPVMPQVPKADAPAPKPTPTITPLIPPKQDKAAKPPKAAKSKKPPEAGTGEAPPK